MLQRQLTVAKEIDTPPAIFSKTERGDRRAKREQVITLSALRHQDENEVLKPILADKAIGAVGTEKGYILKRDAKDVAEQIIIM